MSPRSEYGTDAKSFHWMTAALIGAQFVIGWIMPGLRHMTQPEGLVSLHLSLGATILAITIARLAWRWAFGVPAPETTLPNWQNRAAALLHAALYVVLFALLLSGWAYASSHGFAVSVFGLATLPALFAKGSALGQAIGELHSLLAWTLLGGLGLHIGAAPCPQPSLARPRHGPHAAAPGLREKERERSLSTGRGSVTSTHKQDARSGGMTGRRKSPSTGESGLLHPDCRQ